MNRRRILSGLAAIAVVAPYTARAQFPPRPVVAVLRAAGGWSSPRMRDYFIYGVREQGLEEGRDFTVVVRSAEGDPSREPALITETVAANPAVIVVQTSGLAINTKKATSTIPIVASTVLDPVGMGVAESIPHPGGNVTGFLSTSAWPAKQLELMRQIVPDVTRIGNLFNPSNPAHARPRPPDDQAQIDRLGITLIPVGARMPAELETAFATFAKEGVGAVHVSQDAMFNQEAKKIADLALAARLPTDYGFRDLPDAGGLFSYGGGLYDRWRHIGWYVGKILNGEKPGDLPFQQLEKLELVINMNTAKTLGLTIPPLVFARADELIE
jgi:putative ABC transport system substrate-binding protein